MFQLNAPVVIRVIVKKYEQMLQFTAMRIHVIEGQRLVRIAPPFLPHHSCSATRDFSVQGSEGVIWMCRGSFTNSTCPLPGTILTVLLYSTWLSIVVFVHTCLISS